MTKRKQLINSYRIGDEFHINVPKTVSEKELSFVISRVLMFMVRLYADNNNIKFDKALRLYKEAIAVDVGHQYDMEHKGEQDD